MSKVVRKDVDNLNATITVVVAKADYEPKFKSELNKYRRKAEIKGFRKGKTPIAFIRKMYGKSILVEIVNDLLQEQVNGYLVEEKLDILGQPIPSEDQERIEFTTKTLQDYEFHFDLGLAPVFDVKGASDTTKMEKYKVQILEEAIDKDLDNARKRIGKNVKVEDGIEVGDLINFDVEELDGDNVKEKGWAANFSMLYDKIADEKVKEELLTKKIGDAIRFNVYDLEEDVDMNYVRKYLLDIPEDETQEVGQFFEGKIKEVTRVEMADADQEFFDKYFGEGEIKSLEEAKNKIKEGYEKFYDNQADALMFRDIKENLLAENILTLPDVFLKRWLKSVSKNNTDEVLEKDFDGFKANLTWSLIRNKLTDQFDLHVSEEDLKEGFTNRIKSYYGAYVQDEMIEGIISGFLEDEKQVEQLAEELITQKLFIALKDKVSIVDKEIASDKFDEILKEAKEAARNLPVEEAVSELSDEEE